MSRCPLCNASFSCGVADAPQNTHNGESVECWCMALPRLPSAATLRDGTGKEMGKACCLCPNCLLARQQAIRESHSGG